MKLPRLPKSWDILKPIWESDQFKNLWQSIEIAYRSEVCFPPKELIFNAFEQCQYTNLKVVLIGQDPYHKSGEAHGLSFSVPKGIKIPPSLHNIFREINQNYEALMMPVSGDLTHWAHQGVLLLNTTLTVQQNLPNSHYHLKWHQFTDQVIHQISKKKSQLVFLLWGSFAQKKQSLIFDNQHLVLKSGHPSPLSANQGKWFGNQHFLKTNQFLAKHHQTSIDWLIP